MENNTLNNWKVIGIIISIFVVISFSFTAGAYLRGISANVDEAVARINAIQKELNEHKDNEAVHLDIEDRSNISTLQQQVIQLNKNIEILTVEIKEFRNNRPK